RRRIAAVRSSSVSYSFLAFRWATARWGAGPWGPPVIVGSEVFGAGNAPGLRLRHEHPVVAGVEGVVPARVLLDGDDEAHLGARRGRRGQGRRRRAGEGGAGPAP